PRRIPRDVQENPPHSRPLRPHARLARSPAAPELASSNNLVRGAQLVRAPVESSRRRGSGRGGAGGAPMRRASTTPARRRVAGARRIEAEPAPPRPHPGLDRAAPSLPRHVPIPEEDEHFVLGRHTTTQRTRVAHTVTG